MGTGIAFFLGCGGGFLNLVGGPLMMCFPGEVTHEKDKHIKPNRNRELCQNKKKSSCFLIMWLCLSKN